MTLESNPNSLYLAILLTFAQLKPSIQ